jgi:NHL repeat-containing protein
MTACYWVTVGLAVLAAPAARLAGDRLPQAAATPRVPTFAVDRTFPTIPNDWVLGDVSSVAVDAQDHVWVLHRPRAVAAERRAHAAPAVLEFDATGRLIGSWGGPASGYEWPEREHGIYVDPGGAVWISGNNGWGTPPPPGNSDDMLLKFTSAGKLLLQIGHSGKSGGNADTANVRQAADMFLYRPANELFVADGYGNQRVIVFDAATGAFKRTWGAFGGTPFNIVHGVKVSNDGLVYVADRGNKRVQVFTTSGEYRQQVTIGGDTAAAQTAAGLSFSPDRQQQFLYVADLGNSQIDILDRKSLKMLGAIGKPGRNPGEFGTLHHMAADSKGNIYTAEIGRNKRVQKFVVKDVS